MKIGILTHHYIFNYGAFLQTYALQTAVQKLHPDSEVQVINYWNIPHSAVNIGGFFRCNIKTETPNLLFRKYTQLPMFKGAINKYLNTTPLIKSAEKITDFNFDCVIVGSDEVWNYADKKSYDPVKFGIGFDCKRLVAYAPSVGQVSRFDKIPTAAREGISEKFDFLSARDKNTKRLISQLTDKPIQNVLDPVFLSELPSGATEKVEKITKAPYILFYRSDNLPKTELIKIIDKAHSQGLRVIGTGAGNKHFDENALNVSPFEWAELFKRAEFIHTGTFHGTVLSVINRKPFVNHITIESRKQKILSLLDTLGIKDTYNSDYENEISPTLERLRTESLDYLKKATEGI